MRTPTHILARLTLVALLTLAPLAAQTPTLPQIIQNINISFNGSDAAKQVPYDQEFWKATNAYREHLSGIAGSAGSTAKPSARYCHTYVSYDVADDATKSSDEGGQKWLKDWLKAENGHCDQVLLSFKWIDGISNKRSNSTHHNSEPPTPAQYKLEMQHFLALAASWKASGVFTGSFAYTPWNEPNNSARSGDGLGDEAIPAHLAADYYLELRTVCGTDCTVAAGDFGSNGGMWQNFVQKCSTDVAPKLCHSASYFDTYKHTIDADSATIGPAPHHRPEVWAYHAWDDVNNYVHGSDKCTSPNNFVTCTTLAFVHGLQGSWGKSVIWDTEVGAGQPGIANPSDAVQAHAATFLLILTGLQNGRIQRIYYTKAFYPGKRGDLWGSLFRSDGSPRPAFCVLTKRQFQYPSSACR